ncbi:UbiA prenyltransferase family protein [Rhodanobacter denitrificans]|uniref:UbiA prenyltransferase family protein n=1 Tax=Rhodanobacter denitrificans TaxID=666685 RepID=UPI001F2EDA08|nr:UbiA family prenyltransferase [Rhodanobacter denitrificans]UJJ57016.1 UbiA family prenyltransferase [Rhodanobacter denitrificans]
MRRFLALSRSVHGVLDIAMPGFVALLWLGHFPSWQVLALCLATALAGYTAIYALNDLIGVKDDQEKVAGGITPGYAVEASAMRYPLAQNLISMKGALAWFGCWFALAVLGTWLLNPKILLIVFAAAALEVLYVKLLKVTWWRTVVSGLVKSAGPVAAVFAVIPAPSWSGLLGMLVWLMLWEIGGQNIPADWNDIEEDRRIGARTIPLVLGLRTASALVAISLGLTVLASALLPRLSPVAGGWPFQLAILAAGAGLLLPPAIRLARTLDGRQAARLFDRASLYPLALLAIVTVFVLIR